MHTGQLLDLDLTEPLARRHNDAVRVDMYLRGVEKPTAEALFCRGDWGAGVVKEVDCEQWRGRTYPACKGKNCGCTDGRSHSSECLAEHEACISGMQQSATPTLDAMEAAAKLTPVVTKVHGGYIIGGKRYDCDDSGWIAHEPKADSVCPAPAEVRFWARTRSGLDRPNMRTALYWEIGHPHDRTSRSGDIIAWRPEVSA
jgi:hypothetical protein